MYTHKVLSLFGPAPDAAEDGPLGPAGGEDREVPTK